MIARAGGVALLFMCSGTLSAQLPSSNARALGMGDNYVAAARGFAATSWNPALLGLRDNPGASLAILSVRGVAGMNPISLGDFAQFQGVSLPQSVREEWLTRIERSGGEEGVTGGDVTYVAAQVGRFGFQISSSFAAEGNLSPGAAEMLLFGNAGRTGEAREFDLAGSELNVAATSTAALSHALPFDVGTTRFTVGATAFFTIGHFLISARDNESTLSRSALNVSFPVVTTNLSRKQMTNGSGFGADFGVALQHDRLTLSGVVRNAINRFAWNAENLRFREGVAIFDDEIMASSFEAVSYEAAPAALRQSIERTGFSRVVNMGAAYEHSRALTLTADARTTGEAGVGAEVRALSSLPLRLGAGVLKAGYQVSGGLGVKVGPAHIAASVAYRSRDVGSETSTMVTLFSTTR